MSTRQYIGARYVPKFFENSATGDTTWAANTSYEPLTIVTYNGNSYTSKKTVPAGIGNPSANAEYWASTGLYNAQVETLREEVETLAGDVQELSADIEKINNRRFIFIGDSWFRYTSGAAYTHFMDMVYSALNLMQGTDYYELQGGGYGFLGDQGEGKTFLSLLQSATISNPETITDIYVCGGINDRPYTQAQIESAISAFVSYAKTQFPAAKIKIMCYSWTMNSGYNRLLRDNIIPAYRNASKYGAIYVTNSEYVAHVYGYLDGIHPAQAMQTVLFNAMMSAILQDCCHAKYIAAGSRSVATGNVPEAVMTLEEGWTEAPPETLDNNFMMSLDDNVTHISMARGPRYDLTNITLGHGYTKMATIAGGLIYGMEQGKDIHIPVSIQAITAGGSIYTTGFILIANGNGATAEVYVTVNMANAVCTAVRFMQFSAAFETLCC